MKNISSFGWIVPSNERRASLQEQDVLFALVTKPSVAPLERLPTKLTHILPRFFLCMFQSMMSSQITGSVIFGKFDAALVTVHRCVQPPWPKANVFMGISSGLDRFWVNTSRNCASGRFCVMGEGFLLLTPASIVIHFPDSRPVLPQAGPAD